MRFLVLFSRVWNPSQILTQSAIKKKQQSDNCRQDGTTPKGVGREEITILGPLLSRIPTELDDFQCPTMLLCLAAPWCSAYLQKLAFLWCLAVVWHAAAWLHPLSPRQTVSALSTWSTSPNGIVFGCLPDLHRRMGWSGGCPPWKVCFWICSQLWSLSILGYSILG